MLNSKYFRDSYFWLGLIISSTFFLQLIFTYKAWLPLKFTYPKVGAMPGLDIFPTSVIPFFFYALLVAIVLVNIPRIAKYIFPILFILTLALVLDDINRLQPWLFMHMALLMVWLYRKKDSFLLLRIFLIALYLWSGIHKLNINFAWEVFPYFMKAFGLNAEFYLPANDIGSYALPTINHLAWIVPISEILIGLFLIFTKTKWLSIAIGIPLHLIIIYILGPLGLNWNSVVWIWNLEFIFLLLICFKHADFIMPFSQLKNWFSRIYITIVLVCPALWYFNAWPHNFSYHLYSGYNPTIRFYFEGVNMNILESDFKEFTFYDVDKQQSFIMLDYYLMDKINIPVFAEEYYFKKTAKGFCECYKYTDNDAGLRILAREKFTGNIIIKDYPCSVLVSGK